MKVKFPYVVAGVEIGFPEKPQACAGRHLMHREDGAFCPNCGEWTCAWHYWVARGADGKESLYCEPCAKVVRATGFTPKELMGAT